MINEPPWLRLAQAAQPARRLLGLGDLALHVGDALLLLRGGQQRRGRGFNWCSRQPRLGSNELEPAIVVRQKLSGDSSRFASSGRAYNRT